MNRLKLAETGLSRGGWVIAAVFLFLRLAVAQLPTATILGVVKDSTGAVVPNASLTARYLDTGQTRTALTGSDGSYRFAALPVGSYEVRVEHAGFQAQVRSGLTLTVAQEAVVNFTLEVGAVEEAVEVKAEAPLVNTTSGSLGGLVDEQRVADLPLNGRNFIDLTLLQTGVQQHKNLTPVAGMSGVWFSSNGAPLRSNNFLLDGAIMQNLYGASSASISNTTLGIDGIREYRLVTNSFSADYGMSMGSQMVIVSRAGTNNFHGSLFEYLRNSALDARNFFDVKTSTTPRRLPPFTRNNFGGSVGGPIRKDRAFFHAVYEGVRERLGRTLITNVIPASAKVDGGLVPQISPLIKPLLSLFPDPNLPSSQFTFPFSQPATENYGQARLDYNISANDRMFGRYTVDDGEQITPLAYPQFRRMGLSRAQYGTVSEDHVFSPLLLNTARFSYSRTTISVGSSPEPIGPQFSFVPGLGIGNISIGGVTPFGSDPVTPNVLKQNIFTWSDDLYYLRNRHSLKFGALVNHYQQYMLISAFARGQVNFANLTTFLQGQPLVYLAVTPGSILDRTYHFNTLGFYGQDDVRLTPTFTLNLGLRYEFHTTVEEVRGRGATLRDIQHDAKTTLGPPFKNPSLRNFSPRFGFAWDVQGNGRTALRGGFGLLYDVGGNLGSALLAANTAMPPFANRSSVVNPAAFTLPFFFPPDASGKTLRMIDYLFQQPHMLQYNLTLERQLPFGTVLSLAYGGSRGINIVKTVEGNPTVPQVLPDGRKFWTGRDPRTNPNFNDIELKTGGGNSWYNSFQFGLLKRLSNRLQFQSSYTWSKAIDETQAQLQAEGNSSSAGPSDPSNRKVDRAVATFDVTHNWRFNTIYHLPDLVSSGGALKNVLNGWWISGIVSLQGGYPFNPALQTNRSRSGVIGGTFVGIDRPDLVPGRSNGNITQGSSTGCLGVPAGRKLGGPDLYYDPCAFTIPQLGFLGNAGRNILRGPGFATLDFSLVKDTSLRFLGENGKLEFRAEFFNILNRANFITPGIGIAGGNDIAIAFAGRSDVEAPLPNAGRLTSTASSSRQIQFALKILF